MKKSTNRNTCDQPTPKECSKHVFDFQKRIANKINIGNFDTADKLTDKLLKSHALKRIAVKEVTSGEQTPGPDGKTYKTNAAKRKLTHTIDLWIPYGPSRSIEVPKDDGVSTRTIEVSNLEDRVREKMLELALSPWIEHHLSPRQFGFRPARGCQDAIAYARICMNHGPRWFAKMDVRKLFDEIPHRTLLDQLDNISVKGMASRVIKKWLKDRRTRTGTACGIPQGSPISPTLANLVLASIEEAITESAPECKPIIYADDIIVIAMTEVGARQAVNAAVAYLSKHGLTLNSSKLEVGHTFDAPAGTKPGFTFLGVRFWHGVTIREGISRPYALCRPTDVSLKELRAKVKETANKHEIVKKRRQTTRNRRMAGTDPVELMIIELNSILRGWGNYYRHTNAKEVFSTIDHYVHQRLWRWAKRSFKRKRVKWLKDRCFSGISTDRAGNPLKRKDGTPRERDWIFTSPFQDDSQSKYTVMKLSDLTVGTYRCMTGLQAG